MRARLSLNFMIEEIMKCTNEIAIGYSDAYCQWHIYYGSRGSGDHIEGCGKYLSADEYDFAKAVKYFYKKIVVESKK